MLIKFFGGTGTGGAIANYLVDPNRIGREGNPPQVLRGDIAQTRELIDSQDRKLTYTTGVISFALEDQPTEAQQHALMDDFERLAFAGLARAQYDITWVRHSHTEGGRVELHFLTPRMELASGRAFNIAPPGWERSYAPLRDAYNFEHGWARPDDPARSRAHAWMPERADREDAVGAITQYLEGRILTGEIENRDDILSALHQAGYETPRAGKNYITARDPHSGVRWRLKGRIYEKTWTRDAELDRELASDGRTAEGGVSERDGARARDAHARLEQIIERRARWIAARYPREPEHDPQRSEIAGARHGLGVGRDQGQAASDHSDQRADRRPDQRDLLGRTEPLDGVEPRRGNHRDRSERHLSDLAENRSGWLDLWRNPMRETGGVNEQEPDPDRESALGRIRSLGQRLRGFGARAVASVRALFGAAERSDTASEPARAAFAASERSLGEFERLNERADREVEKADKQVALKDQARALMRGRDLER